MKVDHQELLKHLPWVAKGQQPVSGAECEKLVQLILEGENFAERVKVFIEILTKFGVRIT